MIKAPLLKIIYMTSFLNLKKLCIIENTNLKIHLNKLDFKTKNNIKT